MNGWDESEWTVHIACAHQKFGIRLLRNIVGFFKAQNLYELLLQSLHTMHP